MSFKCLDCGHIFEEGEAAVWGESRGEYWGVSCSEEVSGCPLCHGDYEETIPCDICGSEHLEDELNGGVCEDCIYEHRYDIETCFNIGANDPADIKINCFLSTMFSNKDIECILMKILRDSAKTNKVDCRKFIRGNIVWFAENLVEEVNKNENAKKQS